MATGLSDKIRAIAQAKYVNPAILSGKGQFEIRVRDLIADLNEEGIPALSNTPQICSALQTGRFLRENGLEIESVEGPPSKLSPTVVVRYRVARIPSDSVTKASSLTAHNEAPSDRALRLTEKLRGMLREELAEYGGGEAFLKWIRSEDEDAA